MNLLSDPTPKPCGILALMRRRYVFFLLSICVCLGLSAFRLQQDPFPMQKAKAMLQQLTPEERVGQLFVVSYSGKDVSSGADISRLIQEYHIGGVILKRENGNWKTGEGEAIAIAQLTNTLQTIVIKSATDAAIKQNITSPHYLPLLIMMSQEGDGIPYDELLTEAPSLPSQMAIGATWDPSLSKQAGGLVGREFAALGINVLLGPSLDVLERPIPGTDGDMGARSFGGDPYWVGKMGAAFIQGVHEGSRQKVAVIVTHFPGIGASDRNPNQEIATVLKSMDELQQIDLFPFASVAYTGPNLSDVTDGLMISHIRYQGLQGNIRASTYPISLDPVALNQLLQSNSFSVWRTGGGITISDSLGVKSVRDFYDPTGASFSGRYIAKNAFQAGNDLLLVSDFSAPDKATPFDNIADTIAYFQQQYASDPAFAAKVNEAVTRILAMKYRLYPMYQSGSYTIPLPDPTVLMSDSGVASAICRSAATLLSPTGRNPSEQVLEPPTRTDRILILTDDRSDSACPSCAATPWINTDTLRKTILSLYGPAASKLVNPQSINAFTLQELTHYLTGDGSKDFKDALDNSTLVLVLSLQPKSSSSPSPLQGILSQRPDIVQNRKWIVFALGAPYYLDSTEISKLHAYYGIYSKTPACLNTVVQLVFEPFPTSGSSPVSINELGYNLLTRLAPDPNQLLQLFISTTKGTRVTPVSTRLNVTPIKTIPPLQTTTTNVLSEFHPGDTIWISTGPILDRNQHLVPDGTVIRFRLEYPDAHIPALYDEGNTKDGIAEISYVIERDGILRISAYGEPEPHSVILQFTIGNSPSAITTVTPTSPTNGTPLPTTAIAITPTAAPVPSGGLSGRMGWSATFLALSIFFVANVAVYSRFRWFQIHITRIRAMLVMNLAGFVGYDYVAYGLPGTGTLRGIDLVLAGMGGVLIGLLAGIGILKYGIPAVRYWKLTLKKSRLQDTSEGGHQK
jgi:beta-N-acetylhexosaminidase